MIDTDTRDKIIGGTFIAMLVIAYSIVMLAAASHVARGQGHSGHPPQDQAIHEKFYSNWMRPEDRSLSCCNQHDCYPTLFKKEGGTWFALRREDGEWIPIPEATIEYDRDNPDGRNHVCMQEPGYQNRVYCAIIGGGA